MCTITLLLLVVLTASLLQALSHYYIKIDGSTVEPILKMDGSFYPWTEAGAFNHKHVYNHSLYSEIQICQSPVGCGWDISDASLTQTVSKGTLLSNCNFTERDFPNADLTDADQSSRGQRPSGTDLTSANLENEGLIDMTLRSATLAGATLHYTDLSGAIVSNGNLEHSTLTGTDLTGATLDGYLRVAL